MGSNSKDERRQTSGNRWRELARDFIIARNDGKDCIAGGAKSREQGAASWGESKAY